MNTEIITFTVQLYDEVYALWQQCEGIGLSDADNRENIEVYLKRNPGMSFVAKAESDIVGSILAGHDGRRGYIHHLAVHPSYRRHGIGSKLVDCATTSLSSAGIQKAHLFIFNNNVTGRDFWETVGWISRTDIGVISKAIEPGTGGRC